MADGSGIKIEKVTLGDTMLRLIDTFNRNKANSEVYKIPQYLHNIIRQILDTPTPTLILWGKDFTQFYNDSFIDFQGLAHPTAIGADVSISHPALWQDLKDVISDTLKGDSYKIPHYKWPVQNINISNNSSNHFALSFTPLRDDDGLSVGVILTINRSENDLINDAEQKFREMMMYSPVCMAVLTGPEHVIDIANDSMLEKIWHKKLNEVQGRPLTEIFPELKEQHYPTVLDLVYTTGQYFRDNESVAYLYNNGEIFRFYVDVEYAPLKNSEGEVEGVIVTATDVTEKVEARKKAEDAETRLRLAIEATQLAIWDLDLKTKEIISSARLSEIFGYSPDVQLSHPETRNMVHPDDIKNIVEKAFKTAINTGIYNYEARIILPDSSIRWIKTIGKVIYDTLGEPQRMLGTIMDITEQVTSRQSLLENEARFRNLIKGLPFAVYYCNSTGALEFYNDAAVALWGRQPEANEIWCGSFRVFDISGNLVTPEETHTAKCFKENKPLRGEAYVERPNGELRHVLSSPQPLHDATGNLIGVMNALIDVTDMKKAEQAIIESELRFRTVANTAPVMIWMAGTDKQCYFCNTGWLEYTGRSMEEETGNGWADGIFTEDIADCSKVYDEAFNTRSPFYIEYRLRRYDGAYRWVSDNGVPRYDANGVFEGFIGSCVDIHDQKQSAEKLERLVEERTANLRQANMALERSNEELEQFAFVTSHDLQEPLRKINTFAHLLYDKHGQQFNEDAKKYLDKITQAALRMSRLINDLLNFSRLTRLEDSFVAVDMNETLRNIENDFELLINQKNATISYDKLPAVKAIPLQMNQLLYNLIGNALKFSAKDKPSVINIRCSKLSKIELEQYPTLNNELDYCEIVITDNGIGFKQEYAQKIFEIFQRLNDKSEYEGTGIGLALCNKIVTNHNGLIFAQSEENVGTDFHIILPTV